MTECKSMATPLDRNLRLDVDYDTTECKLTRYRQLVGSLIYLTITQPDLCYLVGLLSQFMQTPRNIHLDCAKKVLRYVSGTMNYGILYKSAMTIPIEGTQMPTRLARKTTHDQPPIWSFGSGAIPWSNKKRPTVSLSITEAEYRDAAVVACEVIWLKRILKDLDISVKDPIILYCDIQNNIHLAQNLVFHDRTKHIKVHYHFI